MLSLFREMKTDGTVLTPQAECNYLEYRLTTFSIQQIDKLQHGLSLFMHSTSLAGTLQEQRNDELVYTSVTR